MDVMSSEKTRVDFNAPSDLVERADRAAELLDVSRTHLLVESLEEHLEELANNDAFRRKIKEAYYEGNIEFEDLESILGREKAMQTKLLRDSLNRDPPEPQLNGELPSDDEFYSSDISEWVGDDDKDASTDEAESRP